ncbi:hypothetical protein [Thermodesulfobacterium hveragerdense]|uniref:hypothetical protein n=1 Tax=Thermodesulfobacterium hveragerdense TaxID=53424 RepID=UPI000405CBEB|nr:hypothetical protein [Thermodesulfobacterium hveragerdense]
MVRKELIELKETLEKEKKALMKGAIEEILKWASYKARLANFLKDKDDFTQEEQEILEEIFRINEKNKMIIQAGLNFVEEAYSFLTNIFCQQETYGKVSQQPPRVISKSA